MINCGKTEPCIDCPALVQTYEDPEPGQTIFHETQDGFRVTSVDLHGLEGNFLDTHLDSSQLKDPVANCEGVQTTVQEVTHRKWLGKITKTVTSITCPVTKAKRITRVQ